MAYTCSGKEQPNNNIIANLPKYAVHGRGATKPRAPVSQRTASLKPTLVLCFATVLYCCTVLRVAPEIQS